MQVNWSKLKSIHMQCSVVFASRNGIILACAVSMQSTYAYVLTILIMYSQASKCVH